MIIINNIPTRIFCSITILVFLNIYIIIFSFDPPSIILANRIKTDENINAFLLHLSSWLVIYCCVLSISGI